MGLGCRFCHLRRALRNLLNFQVLLLLTFRLGLQEKGNKFYVLHEDTWEPLMDRQTDEVC